MEYIAKEVLTMAKVIVFPQKERLPKGLEKEVYRLAKEYIEVLYAPLNLLASDRANKEELDRINELE